MKNEQLIHGMIDDVDNKLIPDLKANWFKYFEENMKELSDRLNNGEALTDEDKEQLKAKFTEFKETI